MTLCRAVENRAIGTLRQALEACLRLFDPKGIPFESREVSLRGALLSHSRVRKIEILMICLILIFHSSGIISPFALPNISRDERRDPPRPSMA